MSEYRVGTGFDAHALHVGVPLVLGGVRIEHPRGLAGHSDGDVLAHALTDAVLGAAGLEDIGALFPSGDPALEGADSLVLLSEAWRLVREAGWMLSTLTPETCDGGGSRRRRFSLRWSLQAAGSFLLATCGEISWRSMPAPENFYISIVWRQLYRAA